MRSPIVFVIVSLMTPVLLFGQNNTTPGEVTTPYPTIHNLAVEWRIQGDDNLNGVVSVQYRAAGTVAWRKGMPLYRIPTATWKEEARPSTTYTWENKHSGSIFDLEPDTAYEIQLSLHDPDGDDAERTVQVRTRPVPQAMPNAPIKRAHPENLAEVMQNAEPGDIVLLEPGNYGYVAVTKDGLPGKPLVIRAEPGGRYHNQQTHEGAALFYGISLQNRKHVILEGLFSSDTIDLYDAEDCAITRCRIHALFGIVSTYNSAMSVRWAPQVAARYGTNVKTSAWKLQSEVPGEIPPHATNCYIADNVIVGMTEWTSEAMAVFGKNMGEGIEISGPGNVICHNRVTGFRDCISTMEGSHSYRQFCVDIYNNDIYTGPDDGIEADFCMGNCRIMRNRLTNCFMGMSSQPSLGGPTYYIRNVLYNVIFPYKFMRHSTGNVVLHNTVVKTGDGASCNDMYNTTFLNNIGLGGGGLCIVGRGYRNGSGQAANFRRVDVDCVMDYNGYGAAGFPFRGNIGGKLFGSLESLRTNTMEKHGVQVDLDIFAAPVMIPDPALKEWCPTDLRLRGGSAAMDAGIVIPNINDNYTGLAPDLGAYEIGQELPVYGPRPVELP